MRTLFFSFICLYFFTLVGNSTQAADLNFGTTVYFTAPDSTSLPGTVLTSSGLTLNGFDFNNAPPTHPMFKSGVYFPVTDCQSHNLWVKVRHIAADPNGTNNGQAITNTTGGMFYGGGGIMIGGFTGFLYELEIFKDQTFTGTRTNILGSYCPTTITVSSLETLCCPNGPYEWLSFEILNPESTGWNLNSINFTGTNLGSMPGFSAIPDYVNPSNSSYRPPSFTSNFPTGSDSVYAITLTNAGYSEFKMTASQVSKFRYGYEFFAWGYQGMSMAFGEGPTVADSLIHEMCYRAGGSIYLKPSGLGPYTYSWSNGASSQNLENVAPGTYTATVTDQAGCLSQISKTINPGPVFTVDLTQAFLSASQEVALSSFVVGGAGDLQYLWSTGSTNDSLITDSNGVYILAVTDGQNCVARDTITVTQFVGIKDNLSATSFSLYPNPADGGVWLQTEELTETTSLQLLNTHGQVVWTGCLSAGTNSTRIDLKRYAKGIYTIFIQAKNGIKQQRLVVY